SIDGRRLDRLTDGRHYLSTFDAVPAGGGVRVAAIRSTPTELPGVIVGDLEDGGAHVALRPVADLNADIASEIAFREPVERWVEVDGREIQAWLIPAVEGSGSREASKRRGGSPPRPTVVEIHGGPHTLY